MSLAAPLEKSQLKRLQAEKARIGSIRKIPKKIGNEKKPFGSHEPKRTRSEFGCGTP